MVSIQVSHRSLEMKNVYFQWFLSYFRWESEGKLYSRNPGQKSDFINQKRILVLGRLHTVLNSSSVSVIHACLIFFILCTILLFKIGPRDALCAYLIFFFNSARQLTVQMMQNPQILAALQERLDGLVGTSTGYVERYSLDLIWAEC